VSLSSGIPTGNGKLRVRCLDSLPVIAAFLLWTVALQARQKNSTESFGMGLTVTVQASEAEILQAVQDVVADGIIQGSKEYNKDEYISGAEAVDSTPVFPNWTGPGRVFYKARKNALDPMNFKDSGDSGTLAIRYVVQPGDEKSAILKVDAIFVDDFHRRVHQSNGSVESAEYAAIQNHLATIHLQKQHSAEEDQGKKQELAAKELERDRKQQREDLAIAQSPDETLQQYVQRLRHEVERTVRSPGAQLRSAPFRSASSIGPLPAGARVVILISTPYWCGIETDGGQTGWVHRSQLELLP
jgi:Bacterial SH3 domain